MSFAATMRAVDYLLGYTEADLQATPIFCDIARNELTTEDLT